jgi:hypothetical protein
MPAIFQPGIGFWNPFRGGQPFGSNCNCCCHQRTCCFCRGYNAHVQWDAAYQFVTAGATPRPPSIWGTCSSGNCSSSDGTWPATQGQVLSFATAGILADWDGTTSPCSWNSGLVGASCGACTYQATFYKTATGGLNCCLGKITSNEVMFEIVLISDIYNVDCDAFDFGTSPANQYLYGGRVASLCEPGTISFETVP